MEMEEVVRLIGPPKQFVTGRLRACGQGLTVGVDADHYHQWEWWATTLILAEKDGKVVYKATFALMP
jgi:hypothetical protein